MRMPIVDGWMFLQAYQDFPEPRAPVIAVSANNRAVAGSTGDVVNFIAKPFDLEELLAVVKKYASSNLG
jgi:CheY-like chemotaxis protein